MLVILFLLCMYAFFFPLMLGIDFASVESILCALPILSITKEIIIILCYLPLNHFIDFDTNNINVMLKYVIIAIWPADMAVPPNFEFRGVVAALPQNYGNLMDYITAVTFCNRQGPILQYRNFFNDQDIVEAVYRWDLRPYQEIFGAGFSSRERGSTSWEVYSNFERHINGGGAPADDTCPADGSAFVSTTRSTE